MVSLDRAFGGCWRLFLNHSSAPPPGPASDEQRFFELQSHLADAASLWIVALAAEAGFGVSVLDAWRVPHALFKRLREVGLLQELGERRPLSLKYGTSETSYGLAPGLRQLVLRWAQRQGTLKEALAGSEQILGASSRAPLIRKLQSGSLVLRPQSSEGDPLVETELRESVALVFQPRWFEEIWGPRHEAIASRILERSLPELQECSSLYRFLSSRYSGDRLPEGGIALSLGAQALDRMDEHLLPGLTAAMSSSARLGLQSVRYFQSGQLDLARRLAQQSLEFSAHTKERPQNWAPLLLLLLLSRSEAPSALLKSAMRSLSRVAHLRSAAKAMRTFLRYRDEAESGLRRLNAHQVPQDTGAWGELILGLTAYCFVTGHASRSAWAARLARLGSLWLKRGYVWKARQALVLSASLEPEHIERLPREDWPSGISLDEEALTPRDGDLAHLFRPREEWETALENLSRLSLHALEPDKPLRLNWFVTLHSGSLDRPGVQEFQKGKGWSAPRRLSMTEAYRLMGELPPEDQRVLSLLGELQKQRGESLEFAEPVDVPHAEMLEALIGHAHVLEGASGGLPVEVVRGRCQVETFDEPGVMRVATTPAGLGPGLNIVRDGERRLSVVRVSASMAEVMNSLPTNLCVPASEAVRALSVLSKLAESVHVKSSHLNAEETRAAQSRPCLRISPALGAFLVELGVRPFGQGGRFWPAGQGAVFVHAFIGGRRVRTERDLNAEKEESAALQAACPLLLGGGAEPDSRVAEDGGVSFILGQEEILDLLSQLRSSGQACDFEWPKSPPFALRAQVKSSSIHAHLRANKGWYLVSGSVALDQVTSLALADLARLPATRNGRFVRLPSGDYLEIEAKVRRLLLTLSNAESPSDHALELGLGKTRLSALAASLGDIDVTIDEESQKAFESLEELEKESFEISPDLRAELRDYQVEGTRFLCRLASLGLGACLADDMGLGKTIQIIAYLLSRGSGKQHLVVAPTSVCTNWQREIRRFAPTLLVVEYVGTLRKKMDLCWSPEKRASRVVIVSYALLADDCESLAEADWDTLVLDEAQFIKNPKSLRAKSAFSIGATMRIAATGTPVENHLGDLWSLFHFLNPDLLGSWRSFQTHFLGPIQRDADPVARETLKALVRPYLLRRTKDQVLDELPALTTVRKQLQLGADDAMRYALLRKQIHEKLRSREGKQNQQFDVLAEITRLRRFCCHPRLVFPDAPQDCVKLNAFVDLAAELQENGHRALVFSQYVDFLELVRQQVSELGISYEYLDGSTPKALRQSRIDRFQEGQSTLFLISLKAGGLGLNLTRADYVVHLDPWWNPAVASQATDRAHRIGQEKPVTVYEFVTAKTIEEDILDLHHSKRTLAEKLLEGGDRVGGASSSEMIEWLRARSIDLEA